MTAATRHQSAWELRRRGAEATLVLRGDWVASDADLWGTDDVLFVMKGTEGATRLFVDVSSVGRWDSVLVAFVRDVASGARESDLTLETSALPGAVQKLLALAESGGGTQPDGPIISGVSVLGHVGLATLRGGSAMLGLAELVGETVLRGGAALAGRSRNRAMDVLQLMRESGPGAFVIVAIVNGLVGAILAFVGAVPLRRFGADIYVADLVGIATVREMAAMMTAIVMAGRTGGAYAAHLATMQGNEEIDALQTLGIPTYDFLVLPRVAALVAMMPLLYLYACAIGLLGGFIVSIAMLDLTPVAFLEQTRAAVAGRQFLFGLIKSVAFGALVALAGCHIGLRAGRSAADVGHAATTAVVAGIVGVIALDAVFAVCANALGI